MRSNILAVLACLSLFLGVVRAAPTNRQETSLAARAAARQYTNVVFQFIRRVHQEYVRPVPLATLTTAALEGLYEAAQERLPKQLRQALDTAQTGDLPRLILSARAKLGDREALRDQKDILASLRALPRVLDPYCGLVSAAAAFPSTVEIGFGFSLEGVEEAQANLAGRLPASETTLELPTRVSFPWRIDTVVPGSPAQRAGFRPGDQITHFDDTEITAANALELFTRLRQPVELSPRKEQTPEFSFVLKRPGVAEPICCRVPRLDYVPETIFGVHRTRDHGWDYWLDRATGIAQIRLGPIEEQSDDQLARALQELERYGLRGLILDLRWCPGGYLTPATNMARIFLKDGVIARADYRAAVRDNREYRVEDVTSFSFRAGDYPIVLLVNGETRGGAELIAAALKDHGRATVVGQRTVGKATIQSATPMEARPDLMFKLTHGTFVRPSGQNLQRFPDSLPGDDWGIRPDLGGRLALSEEATQQLYRWYEDLTLRPGHDHRALPLDDPERDPQRRLACRVLKRLMQANTEERSEPE